MKYPDFVWTKAEKDKAFSDGWKFVWLNNKFLAVLRVLDEFPAHGDKRASPEQTISDKAAEGDPLYEKAWAIIVKHKMMKLYWDGD